MQINPRRNASRLFLVTALIAWTTAAAAPPSFLSEETPLGQSQGFGVALDGGTAIVGQRVFERDGGGLDAWAHVAQLGQSGQSVSIDADTVIVGVPNDDQAGDDAGAAYVYERDAGGPNNWAEVKMLIASDATAFDSFGSDVAIDGDTVLVGANRDDDAGSGSGSAYVFGRDAGGADNWGQVAKITASDAAGGDQFGLAVDISVDTVVVGSNLDDHVAADAGSAYVFERGAGGEDNWGEVKKLTAFDAAALARFGWDVAIDGDTVIAGAFGDTELGSSSGAAYVFERDQGGAGNWGEVKKLTAAQGYAFFGFAVSLSADRALVGANLSSEGAFQSGAAYVFDRDEGGADNWGQTKKLVPSDAETDGRFGVGVSTTGEAMLVLADLGFGVFGSYVFRSPRVHMFVTAGSHVGDFGGLTGGDAICRAEGLPLGGLWKSFLSVQGTDRFSRIPSGVAIVRLDRMSLADDSTDLNGAVYNPLHVEPGGGTAPSGTQVWTGDSDSDGNCVDFSSTGDTGVFGVASETDTDWHSSGAEACTATNRLYCFRFLCPESAVSGCVDTWAKGSLMVSDAKFAKERLAAKLQKGPALTQSDFGNPLATGGTGYTACLYNGAGTMVLQMEVGRAGDDCGGRPCWKAVGGAPPGGKGYAYKDRDRSVRGLQTLSFKGGPAGTSKIRIKAGNNSSKEQRGLPRGIPAALSGSTSLTLQLHGDDLDQCFSVTLDQIQKDLGFFFQAKK